MSVHRFRFALALCTALSPGLFASGAQALPSIELVAAETAADFTDVKTKLLATGLFAAVDVFNAATGTPTLANLQGYASVLVWSNNSFSNPTAMGNVLDTYLRGGGGVVTAVFGDISNGIQNAVGGALSADLPFAPGTKALGHQTLGTIHVPGSPLLAGVTNFDGGSNSTRANVTLKPGAVDVADWSDGKPLIGTQTVAGYQTVELNFYPASSDAASGFWLSSTDGTRLMSNALLFAGTQVDAPEPSSLALLGAGERSAEPKPGGANGRDRIAVAGGPKKGNATGQPAGARKVDTHIKGAARARDAMLNSSRDKEDQAMAALDWSQCGAVESVPGKVSGAWVFRGTRMPVQTVFENLGAGLSAREITEVFDVTADEIKAVLHFAAESLANRPLSGG